MNEELYSVALALSASSSRNAIDAAKLSFEHRYNKDDLETITAAYGRSAKAMGTAYQEWPQYFTEDAHQDYEPSTYQALFNIASLPKVQREKAYSHWSTTTMHIWEVVELCNSLRPRRQRAPAEDKFKRVIAYLAGWCKDNDRARITVFVGGDYD